MQQRLALTDRAARETLATFAKLRRQVITVIADMGDTATRALYEDALGAIDASIAAWAAEFDVSVGLLQEAGFNLGVDMATDPLEALDLGGAFRRVAVDDVFVIGQFRADLIGGVNTDMRKRISAEISGVAAGAATPFDAAGRIGRNLTDRNHFSTIAHRAQAIVVTETGRAMSLGAQGQLEAQAEAVPGLRKRWINAHLPGARETHLAAERRYAIGGSVGPIPVDEPYIIAGFKAMYPIDPSLPPRESVSCHCVSVPVPPEVLEAEAAA